MVHVLSAVCFSLLVGVLQVSLAEDGQCYTFGGDRQCYASPGGHVYPQETRRTSGHAIQWSQAVISKPAPDWNGTAVIDGAFKDIRLVDFKGNGWFSSFILLISHLVKEFEKINTQVIACSVDSQFTHLAWISKARNEGGLGPIKIPLLSDITHEISKAYGVFLQDLGHSLRGLFIIDPKGILRQITMNDLPVGRSVDETLRLVQAFQYTDKHGEVCPAGWKPGSDTIIPDPKEAQKYFSKQKNSD
ncbi:PRDX2_4 [Mytilus coruscus]|uniref:Thioredoxin peroxidase n=1 Tax=Mytilus coruscus TaxID=42192 RepID=A0A6J8E2N3_MYTCO|nr:PRDX2_4 [Mytilus coruscus]